MLKDENIFVNGLRVHLLQWHRDKIANLVTDKNYYVNARIVKNQYEVYTIFIKSAKPIQDYMEIINSFTLIEKKGIPGIYKACKTREKNLNEETRVFLRNIFYK